MGQKVRFAREIGRKVVTYSAVAAAAGATTVETAITLTISRDTQATTTSVAPVPPANRRLCLTSMVCQQVGNATATTAATTFNLRLNTAGAVATNSTPILASVRTSTPATTGAVDRVQVFFDPPLEFVGDGTLTFGITAAATFTTNAPTWDVSITGYEYPIGSTTTP